jgi:hypothetical protein
MGPWKGFLELAGLHPEGESENGFVFLNAAADVSG